MTQLRVPLDDLVGRGRVSELVGETRVLVAWVDGQVVAYEDACGHRGNSLVDGVIRDCVVTCPAHLWRYDLRTGERYDSPGAPLVSYSLEILGDDIVVEVPPPAPKLSIREALLAAAREEKR